MGFKASVKRLAKIALGRIPLMKPDVTVSSEFLGTDYGGWDVFLEPLGPESVIYDFGIGQDPSFPLELIRRLGCTVHAFDPTPGLESWIAEQRYPPEFVFTPVGLAWFDGEIEIRSQSTERETSGTILGKDALPVETRGVHIPVKTLQTLMRERGHTRLDLLKMDIEGAEFDVIDQLVADVLRPDQILVETHRYFKDGLARERKVFEQLRCAGYLLYKVSGRDMEYSYIHRDAYARLQVF